MGIADRTLTRRQATPQIRLFKVRYKRVTVLTVLACPILTVVTYGYPHVTTGFNMLIFA